MDEKEIYEAMGLTPPEAETAQEDTADTTPAPPDGSDSTPVGDGLRAVPSEEQTEVPEERGGAEAAPYTPGAKDAIRAAVDAALAQQAEAHQRQLTDLLARVGLQDPGTGKAITTLEEFDAYQRGEEARRLSRNLQEGKLLPEDLQALVGRAMEQAKPPQPEPQGGVTQEQIARELAAIHQMDERVNSLEDILKLETGPAFQEAVRRGNSFLDAFRLANFDIITRRAQEEAAAKAAQAAANTARSKDHLLPSESRGTGAAAVPRDVMDLYRQLMPGKSETDIMKHYNRFLVEAGKEI